MRLVLAFQPRQQNPNKRIVTIRTHMSVPIQTHIYIFMYDTTATTRIVSSIPLPIFTTPFYPLNITRRKINLTVKYTRWWSEPLPTPLGPPSQITLFIFKCTYTYTTTLSYVYPYCLIWSSSRVCIIIHTRACQSIRVRITFLHAIICT